MIEWRVWVRAISGFWLRLKDYVHSAGFDVGSTIARNLSSELHAKSPSAERELWSLVLCLPML